MTVEDRITALEQQLAAMDGELRHLRAGQRPLRMARTALGTCVAILAVVLSLGTASAGHNAAPLTVTAPFRVVSSGGALLMQVDEHGVFYYKGGQVAASLTSAGAGAGPGATAGGGGGAVPLTIKAPFRVVDASGALVMQADATGVSYYQGGTLQVALRSNGAAGGELFVNGAQGTSATIGTTGSNMGLRILKDTTLLANLVGSTAGGYLSLRDPSGALSLQLASTSDGGLIQSDSGNKRRVALGSTAAGGFLDLFSTGDQLIGQLAEHPQGGYLALGNQGGTSRVQAGVLPNDNGVVRAFGPAGFNFIQGRTGQ